MLRKKVSLMLAVLSLIGASAAFTTRADSGEIGLSSRTPQDERMDHNNEPCESVYLISSTLCPPNLPDCTRIRTSITYTATRTITPPNMQTASNSATVLPGSSTIFPYNSCPANSAKSATESHTTTSLPNSISCTACASVPATLYSSMTMLSRPKPCSESNGYESTAGASRAVSDASTLTGESRTTVVVPTTGKTPLGTSTQASASVCPSGFNVASSGSGGTFTGTANRAHVISIADVLIALWCLSVLVG